LSRTKKERLLPTLEIQGGYGSQLPWALVLAQFQEKNVRDKNFSTTPIGGLVMAMLQLTDKLEAQPHGQFDALIEVEVTLAITGLGRSTLYKLMKEERFPAQVEIEGLNKALWSFLDVQQWVQAQIARSKQHARQENQK